MNQHKITKAETKRKPQGKEPWHKPTLSKLAVPTDTLFQDNISNDGDGFS